MIDLRLGPLDYREAAMLWGIDDPETFLHVHACVGGYPGYRRVIPDTPGDVDEFDQWVCDNLLDPVAATFSHTEVDYLLSEDPRVHDKSVYYGILGAVAGGSVSLAKIGSAVGKTKEAVRSPVRVLQSAGYLDETNDLLRKHQTVTVSDPVIRFDRIIAAPRLDRLELGEAESMWRESRPGFRSMILGPHFEHVCREWLRRFASAELDVPEGFGGVGTASIHDHQKRARHEIDVFGLKAKTVTYIGEAKATLNQRDLPDLARLERIREVLAAMDYDVKGSRLGLFSRTGFAPRLQVAVESRPDVDLIDLDRLYGR